MFLEILFETEVFFSFVKLFWTREQKQSSKAIQWVRHRRGINKSDSSINNQWDGIMSQCTVVWLAMARKYSKQHDIFSKIYSEDKVAI